MQVIHKLGRNLLYKLDQNETSLYSLPSSTYIISTPPARKIHFSPTLIGSDLFKESEKCSEVFLQFALKLGLLKNLKLKDVYELILLSGGCYYFLNKAFNKLFGTSLQTGFIGVKRYFNNGIPKAVISYDNFEGVPDRGITLIGDTIGTGATIYNSLKYYLKKVDKMKKKVDKILVFTIAGALPGAQALGKLEKEIIKEYKTYLHVFFCEAIFGLEDNNIDMKYFRKDTIAPDYSLKLARKQFGEFFGTHFCSIWDWGERNKDFLMHLKKVIHEAKRLKREAVCEEDLRSLDTLILQANKKIRAYKKTISF